MFHYVLHSLIQKCMKCRGVMLELSSNHFSLKSEIGGECCFFFFCRANMFKCMQPRGEGVVFFSRRNHGNIFLDVATSTKIYSFFPSSWCHGAN